MLHRVKLLLAGNGPRGVVGEVSRSFSTHTVPTFAVVIITSCGGGSGDGELARMRTVPVRKI